ncbi:hypothetical protein [Streptomyces acidicola]|uniref:hypothetical protein n=1 Tax=Streptomyces acidicola TaxID=2596892 RepID=UPI0034380819
MGEKVVVRCPDCRRDHRYAAPAYPCVCGAPVSPPLNRFAVPTVVTHRTWEEDWVSVRCGTCGRDEQWPHPELGCPCGTVLRVPVAGTLRPARTGEPYVSEVGAPSEGSGPDDGPDSDTEVAPPTGCPSADTTPTAGVSGSHTDTAPAADRSDAHTGTGPTADPGPDRRPARTSADRVPGKAAHSPDPHGPGSSGTSPDPGRVPSPSRPAFQPVTIRTARDAVTAAALYLRWLGYRDVRRADQRPPSGIGLAARGVLAQVDPTVRPASLRDVECLWLTAMTESAVCLYFSLAGFAPEARGRADSLGVPLFVLDLTGTPRPVNGPARELIATGA